MRKIFFILCLTIATLGSSQQVWSVKALFGGPRTSAVGFSVGSYGYIGLGYDDLVYKRSFREYDPVTDVWTLKSNFADPSGSGLARDLASCFNIGNFEYIGGGQGTLTFFKDLWEYDPINDNWAQKASMPGNSFKAASSFVLNNKGYFVCGQDSSGLRSDVWEYDNTTNIWTQKASFAGTPRRQAVGFAVNNKGYICTGDATDGYKNDTWEFDPVADTWTQRANFPGFSRYGAVAFVIGNRAFVGLGYDSTLQYTNDFWEYTASTDSWSGVIPFPWTPRASAVAFTIGNKGYVGTGYNQTVLEDFWEFDATLASVHDVSQNNLSVNLFNDAEQQALHIQIADKNKLPLVMNIYDVKGRKIQKEIINATEQTVHLSIQAPAVYIASFTDVKGNTIGTKKIFLGN